MRRHAFVRVVTSAFCFALATAPAHAAPIAGATKKPLPPPETPAETPPGETPPTEPGATEPGATEPGATEPGATEPGATEPGATEPGATEPKPEDEAKPEEKPETKPPSEPVPDPNADRPEEPRVGGKPRKGKGLMIAGGTTLGAGIAATIAFSLMTRRCDYNGPLHCRLQDQDVFLIPLGSAAMLLGAMLLGVGIGYNVQYKKWERWKPGDEVKKKRGRKGRERSKTALVPGLLPGGGGLVWAGKF